MEAVPMPIVMGMVAGVFLQFGLDWVQAFRGQFWIDGRASLRQRRAEARAGLPPLIAALAAGAAVIAHTGSFAPGLDQVPTLVEPRWHVPPDGPIGPGG